MIVTKIHLSDKLFSLMLLVKRKKLTDRRRKRVDRITESVHFSSYSFISTKVDNTQLYNRGKMENVTMKQDAVFTKGVKLRSYFKPFVDQSS